MRKVIKIQILIIAVISLFLASCKDKVYEESIFTGNVPVYMSFDDFRSSVNFKSAQEMSQMGKIYFYNDYLFINELYKGIHIINNSDPSNPVNEGFIEIPGNVDMAIKDNVLFADSYIDLVAIYIADLSNPMEVGRVENAFPDIYPPTNPDYPIAPVDVEEGVVIDWKIEEVKVKYDVDYDYNPYRFYDQIAFAETDSYITNDVQTMSVGIGGSLARFAIKDNTLLAINNGVSLKMFDISQPKIIVQGDSINIWTTIETLFTKDENLFIGSTSGMYIYDITNPNAPILLSEYWHITSCDPVVVDDEYAYVTLRTGTTCWGDINELHVIDITNLSNPVLVKEYQMYNPHGLGIDDKTLFICDGTAGLKIFDATDPWQIAANQIIIYDNITALDVIPLNNVLMLIAEDGLYQYDYSDLENISQISYLPIGN